MSSREAVDVLAVETGILKRGVEGLNLKVQGALAEVEAELLALPDSYYADVLCGNPHLWSVFSGRFHASFGTFGCRYWWPQPGRSYGVSSTVLCALVAALIRASSAS